MSFTLSAFLWSLGLFAGMLLLLEVGRRLGQFRIAQDPEGARAGFGAIEGAVLALLGLLLAFTVTGAGSRLDARRNLIVEEANAIGTAYLRLDVLPTALQPALREEFRRYLDARLDAYRKVPDMAAVNQALGKANALQGTIWRQAIAGVRADGAAPQATAVLLPALNSMIDITTTRTMAAQFHPPAIVFVMLFVLALLSALLSGYGMAGGKSRSWLHMICFPAVIAITVYVILDLEHPRLGFIRVDDFDQALIDLRNAMK